MSSALQVDNLMKSESHPVMSNCLQPCGLYSPWNSPGQNTGVGSLSLLQVMFPIQGLNPGLLHCRRILYQLSHRGSPRILEEQCLFFIIGNLQNLLSHGPAPGQRQILCPGTGSSASPQLQHSRIYCQQMPCPSVDECVEQEGCDSYCLVRKGLRSQDWAHAAQTPNMGSIGCISSHSCCDGK